MKILVISDTHIIGSSKLLPNIILELLTSCDMIIHAGDYISKMLVRDLQNYNFIGVSGNMDDEFISMTLPKKIIITIEDIKFGIAHGWGTPDDLSLRIANNYFSDEKIDVLIHGHSHIPKNSVENGIYVINPGSVCSNHTDKKHSYAILTVQHGQMNVEHFYF